MKTLSLAVLLVGVITQAANADSFTVDAARVTGQYSCIYSKANGGSINCATSYGAQSIVPIAMNPKQDGTGFVGTDLVSEQNAVFLLEVESDTGKKISSVSTVHLESYDNKTIEGGISASSTANLTVVNLAPIHIEIVDDQTIKLDASFYAYASSTSTNMVSNHNHHDLEKYLSARIQPVLTTVIR